MVMMIIFALIIFVVFAVVGGLVVWFIVRNQEQSGDGGPPRGFPRDGNP